MQHIEGKKYIWQFAHHAPTEALSYAQRYNISIPVAQTLLARGYNTHEAVEQFLFTPATAVAHPALLKDAPKSVDRIIQAINNQEKILVFGDYDVDGITSSALMMLCLKPIGALINFFLPHRVRDGYGLSTKIVERAAQNNYKVIITVDNGISAFEQAKRAKELGIDLIITDHHRPHDAVPDAFALVNPHQADCAYPYKTLAGVGVTFKLLSLLYERLNLQLPAKAYELLLLGTIADVVPLTGENRYWVRHGLKLVNAATSFAFNVLKQNGKLDSERTISATNIGFSIAPQINALGRLEDPRRGVKFLIGSDHQDIEQVGKVLAELNQIRKTIERSIFVEIVHKIETKEIDLERENIIMAASSEWPPGVIGLVASRLVGAYGKPALLFHITDQGVAKGSCRSIAKFNMFDALAQCKELLISFGGHSVAAGLSLPLANVEKLKEYLELRIAQQLTPFDLRQKIDLDAQLHLQDATKKLMEDLAYLEPFGHANPQPTFYVRAASFVQQPMLLKDAHVKATIFSDGILKPIIFFNRPELFEFILSRQQDSFDIAAQVTENYWNGKTTIELTGIDIALSDK